MADNKLESQIGDFKSPEELAQALDNKNKTLAERVRAISKKAIETDSKDLRQTLKDELNAEEQEKIREALPDTGVATVFNKTKGSESPLGALGLGGVIGEEGINGIEKTLSWGEGIMKWWDNLMTGIESWMWTKFPKIAEMLGLDDPRSKLEEEAKKKAEAAKEKAGELKEKAKEIAKPKADTFAKIYFKIFRASSELDEVKGIDINKNAEEEIARCVFENSSFQEIKYNDLKNPNNVDTIYNQIQDKLGELPDDIKNNPEKIKKYIKLVIASIAGGQENQTTGWGPFKKTNTVDISRGNKFLKAHYKNIESENPSMKDLFGKLTVLSDFDIFHNGEGGDIEDILGRMKGKVTNLYEGGASQIKNLSEGDFDVIKESLDPKLRNMGEFEVISIGILGSSKSRNLGNNFGLTNATDSISKMDDKSKELLNGFIGNEGEGLIKYGNDMFQSFFASGDLISSTKGVNKNSLTLKEVYSIYLITGGKTKMEDLTPMQRLNITTKLMFGFGDAQDVGSTVADTITKITNGQTKINPEVENILLSLGKATLNLMKDGAETLTKFGYGFATKNPVLAAGILVIALKFPFFTKKQSLLGKLS